MPEQVFRDLTPDGDDVPCETWSDIDGQGMLDLMLSFFPEDPGDIGLIAMVRRAPRPRLDEATKARVKQLSPEFLELLLSGQDDDAS
jgi:hypothetical protein